MIMFSDETTNPSFIVGSSNYEYILKSFFPASA